MAGLDEAGFTIKTLRQGDVFPTTDYLHSYSPLPTSFTFESTCTDHWTLLNPITPTNIYYPIPASCQPNGETDSTYSPGTCISNYHMVALTEYRTTGWTSGGQRAWGAVCCRDGMTAGGIVLASYCSASFSFSTPYITATYGSNAYPSSIPAANRTATIVLDEGLMGMSPMVVYWQEADLSLFDPEYATRLASKLGLDFTPTGSAAVTAETASPPDRSQPPSATSSTKPGPDEGGTSSKSDLSIGAKAGIGVGVAIAVILAVVVGLVLYRRRVRKQRALDQTLARQNEQPELVQTRAA